MVHTILHIDMNSYFATLEQQANPLLRGKPIVVSGRPHIHSVVAAASIEAKKFGVRSGMNTWEARKLCPHLIFIPGDPAKYMATTNRLIKIFRDYSPSIEIFSIDEVFLDMTHDTRDTRIVALEIKKKIREEVGSWMCCSIGIAKNKLLAKLASEKNKPDGLTVIDDQNLDQMLLSSQLIEFCGIGRQTLKHLQAMGIYTVEKLRRIPEEYLTAAFGVTGKSLRNMAFGVDDSELVTEYKSPEAKSFSHSLTLPAETFDRDYVASVLLYLSEKVARRMRQDQFCGRVVHCNGAQKALPHHTDNGQEIFTVASEMLGNFPIRAVHVGLSDLQKKYLLTGSLLPEWQKEEKIISALDRTNDHFGENTIFRATVLPAFSQDKNVAGIRTKFRFN